MDLGIPIPTIDVSVSMREISSLKDQRQEAEALYGSLNASNSGLTVDQVEEALYFQLYYDLCSGHAAACGSF